jgi:hypothetical protein
MEILDFGADPDPLRLGGLDFLKTPPLPVSKNSKGVFLGL